MLLGLKFTDMTVAEAAAHIAARPPDAPFGFIVTPNAEHLVRLAKDPALAAVYRRALLRVMDSRWSSERQPCSACRHRAWFRAATSPSS
ncbi:hypothetical protein [Belnapia sp. F-4-1]|uniref:hypothetical protein n=1 Tax=Belnapia sp. F-4-1 TaxID=1545443 RepID=UPI001364C3F6|nr:hypothetical protein [Belnapia sp. F-4-1]